MPQTPEENVSWLMEQWTAALAAALDSMTDERPEASFTPATGMPAEGEALCWEQSFEGIPHPGLWVKAPEKTWLDMGRRTLRAAGIETAEPADARNTYLEILNQSLSSLAQSLSARLAKEVVCERGCERELADPAATRFSVTLRFREGELALEAALAAGLVAALEPGPPAASQESVTPQVRAASGEAPGTAPSKTLDLLLDVDLPVSVSFGRTRIPIKEILKLTTGSIVELNRSVSEPVEVIVNNCIVARGEVVVIEGNYGVRIHQIMSRQDRLRSLR
ncbi:MAG TPA: flagellar motor switch protein FliN [Bryobacteraceae bacterium]|nr:flagellar motor switch protein FliN [Bryobacteraceae bacterium]